VIIALDGTPLTEPTGGIARYAWELARSLAELHPGDEYWLLSDQTFAMPLDRPSNLHSGGRPQSAIDKRWWLWGLQHEMQRHGVELFHGTDFSVPYVPRGRPSVMTVHDLSPWLDESWNHATSRVKNRTPLLLRLGLAKTVITPSEAVRKASIERFQLAPETVVAVPLAARELFRPVEYEPADIPYFLFVGTLESRKNISGLIDAWRKVRERTPVELRLVGRLRDGFALPEYEGLLHMPGIDDAALPALYSGAAAFVYPSHYEGFGLPVLEAMQCGCPVITSQDPAITEVSGDAAIHVDAGDVDALCAAMQTVLTERGARERLLEAGLARAAQFHWRDTARHTREVYAAALS
jgi:glycosyltransferase involved in cell wall biosynthesis